MTIQDRQQAAPDGSGSRSAPAETFELIRPCADHEAQFRAMAAEYVREGADWERRMYGEAIRHFPRYLKRLGDLAEGRRLPPNAVRSLRFWLRVNGERIVATSRLRLELTEHMTHEIGHIGYGTRPTERRKGYGAKVCELTLAEARKLGMKRVLITCDADNVASRRIIVRNGGVLENEVVSRETGKLKQRYWVTL